MSSIYDKTDHEIEIEKRIRRRDIIEMVETVIATLLFLTLAYLCMAMTPPQMSAECDLAAEGLRAAND